MKGCLKFKKNCEQSKKKLLLKLKNIRYVESPVMGGPVQAEEGILGAIVGSNQNDFENSLNEFLELINLNRTHVLSDNCQYWIGEVYYKQKLFEQSIFEFEKVFSFKDSNKLDDAQYKIILC